MKRIVPMEVAIATCTMCSVRNVRVGEKKASRRRQNHAAADAEKTGEETVQQPSAAREKTIQSSMMCGLLREDG